MMLDSPVRTDNRLDTLPMAPVTCANCSARVLVRKSSWNQTSVQWNAEASARCSERTVHVGLGVFLACSALKDSIISAVRHGDLPTVDEIANPAT
jgi:hypothetical protein